MKRMFATPEAKGDGVGCAKGDFLTNATHRCRRVKKAKEFMSLGLLDELPWLSTFGEGQRAMS